MGHKFLSLSLTDADPLMERLITLERERQERRLIMIASESICPQAVLDVLASPFNNIYAEGYPSTRMTIYEDTRLDDVDYFTVAHRRYADRRYYKGVDYANLVESLAIRRVREIFATPEYPPERIYANVQPLSGAAANNAVYNALLSPGDTIMGMLLTGGGHLTHGSPSNRSGLLYNVVSYEPNRATGKIDYDHVRQLALKHRPKLIIAGYSAYPWSPDWGVFREIADEVGAYLMADIAHTAGLVVGGVHPNPVGHAHVITFTTHKTLCGPRGACILTTEPEIAEKVDAAVFPGEQGGPHIHQIAAKAVCFSLAARPAFKDLMKRVVENAKALSEALKENDIPVAYGGTDTHLVMVDLHRIRTPNGQPLTGEIASRILEFAGIVVNKNTLPDDENAAHPSAVRFGTTWATQRGMGEDQMRHIARLTARILKNIHPFFYLEAKGPVGRGKIDPSILDDVRREVDTLLEQFPVLPELKKTHDYPHFFGVGTAKLSCGLGGLKDELGGVVENGVVVSYGNENEEFNALMESSGGILDSCGTLGLLIRGPRAHLLLDDILTCNVRKMNHFEVQRGFLLDTEGNALDEMVVVRLDEDERGDKRFYLVGTSFAREHLKNLIRMAADGYLFGDKEDIHLKIEGPALVYDLAEIHPPIEVLRVVGRDVVRSLGAISAELKELKHGYARRVLLEGLPLTAARIDITQKLCECFLFIPYRVVERVWNNLRDKGLHPVGWRAFLSLRHELGLPIFKEPIKAVSLLQKFPHHFDLLKPFFVGQKTLLQSATTKTEKEVFQWKESKEKPLKRTALFQDHKKRTKFLIPFAGWEMPVWYSRVTDEHNAVRNTAGLFDVSHMGLFEFKGPDAADFLDMLLSNYVHWFHPGQAFYAYMLDPDGVCIDDTFLYRLSNDHFWMVVNAVNTEKDKDWIKGVLEGRWLTDKEIPGRGFRGRLQFRDLKDPSLGDDRWVNIALQGPNALKILLELIERSDERAALRSIRRSEFTWLHINNIRCMVARTGYTGERVGFEIYIPWAKAQEIWSALLERGQPFGLRPCGLGARDSTRTEAGLPLYGHELAGPFNVTPIEAGYGGFVKFHKPYFIGRKPLLDLESRRTREIVRFRVLRRGARALHLGDPVVDARRGRIVGYVTSCVLVPDGHQVGMAIVERSLNRPNFRLAIYPLPQRKQLQMKALKDWEVGDFAVVPVDAVVIERFMAPPTTPSAE